MSERLTAYGMRKNVRGNETWGSTVSRAVYPYLYLLPALGFMIFATFIPIAYTLYISLTNYSLFHFQHFDLIGLQNYVTIFAGLDLPTFGMVLEWTVLFAFFSTGLSFAVGLFLALLLNNQNLPERNLYRTLLIVPWALPGTIMLLAWSGILNPDFGYLNLLLHDLGLPAIPWLNDPLWAKIAVVLVNVWASFPFMMTACLGALQSIPQDLIDAALIDGAGRVARFRNVTLPILRAVVLPLLINNFAFQFNNFNVIYLLTTGGPPTSVSSMAGATDILASYTYSLTLTYQRYGLAAAYVVIVFLIIGIVSVTQMKLSHAFEETL
jgi:arabinogalactan oligomer/maltooligosaccharide transport system permease protein